MLNVEQWHPAPYMKEIKNDPYLFAEISTKMDQCHKTVTDMTRLLISDTYGLGNHSIEFSESIFELESRRQVRELNISRSNDGFEETPVSDRLNYPIFSDVHISHLNPRAIHCYYWVSIFAIRVQVSKEKFQVLDPRIPLPPHHISSSTTRIYVNGILNYGPYMLSLSHLTVQTPRYTRSVFRA